MLPLIVLLWLLSVSVKAIAASSAAAVKKSHEEGDFLLAYETGQLATKELSGLPEAAEVAGVVNAIKAEVAKRLTDAGRPPKVLTAGAVVGAERANQLFQTAYDEHAHRIAPYYQHLGK